MDLSVQEREIIRRCLLAAVDEPLFPDWEFATLVGASRDEVRAAAEQWDTQHDPSQQATQLAASVLNNLIGYPHGRRADLPSLVGADAAQLRALLRRMT